MAGNDCKFDAKMDIADFIERKVRDLLESDMGDFDDPAWVQATELFNEVVVPCKNYYSEGLMALGFDIVKKAKNHDCKVVFQTKSGHNISDYLEKVNSIKTWIMKNRENI